jgi:hypothetical protein
MQKDRVRLVLTNEGTEPKAITHTAILDALNSVRVSLLAAPNVVDRQADRRTRCAEIDDKRARAAQSDRARQRREELVNANV